MTDLKYILRRITQTELAKRLGMTKANVTHWLRNEKVPVKRIQMLKVIREQLKREAR